MDASVTAFLDERKIAEGDRGSVTRLIEDRYSASDHNEIRVFDDETGRRVDLDYWDAGASRAVRGRPRLGVKAREVTLLPRHWEWLARQPGGASGALRRLVDEARQRDSGSLRRRRDAVYHFMQAMCGDRPGYEEALRLLYRGDREGFRRTVDGWPRDLIAYLDQLVAA